MQRAIVGGEIVYARLAARAGGNHEKKCSDHESFITKIYIYGISSNFTKILNHENLELYGTTSTQTSEISTLLLKG